MDYMLSEDLAAIREICGEIAEKHIRPVRALLDEENRFPREIMGVLAKSDLFTIYIPEAYGGTGMGSLALCVATEELSRACSGVAVSYAANALGAMPVILFGTEEQKQKFLPPLASGEKLSAFALTESGAGSDAAGVKTRAVRDGDTYILNGTKQWITNGGEADIYTVFASDRSRPGARGVSSALSSKKGTPGFSFGKKEDKMGIRASSTRELIFQDCRVPTGEHASRPQGMGFFTAMKTFDQSQAGCRGAGTGDRSRARSTWQSIYSRRARAVRSADRQLPGTSVHARRHGDEGRSGQGAGL